MENETRNETRIQKRDKKRDQKRDKNSKTRQKTRQEFENETKNETRIRKRDKKRDMKTPRDKKRDKEMLVPEGLLIFEMFHFQNGSFSKRGEKRNSNRSLFIILRMDTLVMETYELSYGPMVPDVPERKR